MKLHFDAIQPNEFDYPNILLILLLAKYYMCQYKLHEGV